jgi:hypothetical protein
MAKRNAQQQDVEESGGRGKGSKPDAPRGRKGQTSGQGSSGARKSKNRPGASGTGPKKTAATRNSASKRVSGTRSGAGGGAAAKTRKVAK